MTVKDKLVEQNCKLAELRLVGGQAMKRRRSRVAVR